MILCKLVRLQLSRYIDNLWAEHNYFCVFVKEDEEKKLCGKKMF